MAELIQSTNLFVGCLESLSVSKYLSRSSITKTRIIPLMKSVSTYLINKNRITKSRLKWADEYFVVSVSESAMDKVR